MGDEGALLISHTVNCQFIGYRAEAESGEQQQQQNKVNNNRLCAVKIVEPKFKKVVGTEQE